MVVSGHTHSPLIESRGGVLYINPGSAGPRRFLLPISIGFLRLDRKCGPGGMAANHRGLGRAPSLRAKRSNPWIATALKRLAMTIQRKMR